MSTNVNLLEKGLKQLVELAPKLITYCTQHLKTSIILYRNRVLGVIQVNQI